MTSEPEPAAEPTAWNHVDTREVPPRSAAARSGRLLKMLVGLVILIAGVAALVAVYR